MINPFELIPFNSNSIPEYKGLYFMFNSDNELIYVGKANNIKKRLKQHYHFWINEIEKICSVKYDASDILDEEMRYITKYLPKYNSESGNIDYNEPNIRIMTPEIERSFRQNIRG